MLTYQLETFVMNNFEVPLFGNVKKQQSLQRIWLFIDVIKSLTIPYKLQQ